MEEGIKKLRDLTNGILLNKKVSCLSNTSSVIGMKCPSFLFYMLAHIPGSSSKESVRLAIARGSFTSVVLFIIISSSFVNCGSMIAQMLIDELLRRAVAKRRVQPDAVIVLVEEVLQVRAQVHEVTIGVRVDLLALERLEKALTAGVVIGVRRPTHARDHLVLF